MRRIILHISLGLALIALILAPLQQPISTVHAQGPDDCPPGLELRDCIIIANSIDTMSGLRAVEVDSWLYGAGIEVDETSFYIVSEFSGFVTLEEPLELFPIIRSAELDYRLFAGTDGDDTDLVATETRVVDGTQYLQLNESLWIGLLTINPTELGFSLNVVDTLFDLTGAGLVEWTRNQDVNFGGGNTAVFQVEASQDAYNLLLLPAFLIFGAAQEFLGPDALDESLLFNLSDTLSEIAAVELLLGISTEDDYLNFIQLTLSLQLPEELREETGLGESGLFLIFYGQLSDHNASVPTVSPPDDLLELTDLLAPLFSFLEELLVSVQ
jgi:hypothetical protein